MKNKAALFMLPNASPHYLPNCKNNQPKHVSLRTLEYQYLTLDCKGTRGPGPFVKASFMAL